MDLALADPRQVGRVRDRRYSVAGVEQADLGLDKAILEGLRDEFWQFA